MATSTKAVPEGLHTLTTQIVAADATKVLEFLKTAFGAEAMHIAPGPDGKGIMHGAVRVGDSVLFLSDAAGFSRPTTTNIFMYVSDTDATYKTALAAGAKAVAPVADMFWGDRWGMVEDPFGNHWQIATHLEDVAPDEMQRRMAAQASKK
jgi:PhnB protein